MSFIDDVLDVGSSVWNMFTGPGTGAAIARATALGYLLNEVTDSINKESQTGDTAASTTPDYGVREQVDPDTDNSIPVVYGEAFIGGYVTDAVLTNDNQSMWYCLTLCEMTGNLELGQGDPSEITFEKIYWNETEIAFQSDGITAASLSDEDGNTSTDINGLVKVYCFSGGSTLPVVPTGYSNGGLTSAYGIFPNWSSAHTMSDLVFALVRVDYSKEKEITGLGNMKFKLKNTMTNPGDCVYDYMTNTRYGAGIVPEEIKSS